MMQKIETARLILRPFTLAYLDELIDLYADPEVMKYIGSGKPRSREETQNSLNSFVEQWENNGFGMWAIFEKIETPSQEKFIGRGGLCYLDKTPEIEVGYALARSSWGKGFATELTRTSLKYGFEQLELDRIVGVTNPQNQSSRRVLEKSGLKFAGMAHYYKQEVTYYVISRQEFYSNGQESGF